MRFTVGALPGQMRQMLSEMHRVLPGTAAHLQHIIHRLQVALQYSQYRGLVVLTGLGKRSVHSGGVA